SRERHSPPCITARRGGCVIKKMSRSDRSGRSRGRFPLHPSENHPGLALSGASRYLLDRSATPPCGDARRGVAYSKHGGLNLLRKSHTHLIRPPSPDAPEV